MIEGLKPYPSYRDSGEAWLGQTPAHWSIRRLKTMFNEVVLPSRLGTEKLLSLRMERGLVDHHGLGGKVIPPKNLIGYKRVAPGQIVVNRMRAAIGVFGLAREPGIVSPDYAVLSCIDSIDAGYYLRLFKTPQAGSIFRMASKGMGTGHSGFMRLYTDQFGRIAAPFPGKDEQTGIVRYLNHSIHQIDLAIAAKRQFILLAAEKRDAHIQQLVLRGNSPSVKYKDSAIEGVGEIPSHWLTPLGQRVFTEMSRKASDSAAIPLSLSQRDGLISTTEMKERSLKTSTYDNWKAVIPGDLVVNRFKAHLGVFFASSLHGIVSFHYGVFSSRMPVLSKYYELLYHTSPYKCIFAGRSNGMTVGLQNLSNQNFYNVRTLYPPLEEQREIIAESEEMQKSFRQATMPVTSTIGQLIEYRTRLIADIVTGKLDVRAAAAALPADAEPMSVIAGDEDSDVDEDADA